MTLPLSVHFSRHEGIALPAVSLESEPPITFWRHTYQAFTRFSIEPVEQGLQPTGTRNWTRIGEEPSSSTRAPLSYPPVRRPTPEDELAADFVSLEIVDDDPTRDYVLDRTFRADEPAYRYLKS